MACLIAKRVTLLGKRVFPDCAPRCLNISFYTKARQQQAAQLGQVHPILANMQSLSLSLLSFMCDAISFFLRRETRRLWLMYNRPRKSSTLTECGSVPSLPPTPDEFAPRSVDRVRVVFYRRCWDTQIYNSPPPHVRDSLVAECAEEKSLRRQVATEERGLVLLFTTIKDLK